MMNYTKLILCSLLMQLSVGNLYAQKIKKKITPDVTSNKISLNQKAFVWQLIDTAVLPVNTFYKELVTLSDDDDVTITRYYTTVSTKLTEDVDKKNTQVFKDYTPTLKNKKLKLVNNGPYRNEYFNLILNKQKEITQLINNSDKRVYKPIEWQPAPMTLAQ